MRKHLWFLPFLFALVNTCTSAQQPPKREFRGAWVATVANIDWPSAKGLPSHQQQAEFIHILDQFQQTGINAVVVQVRSVADAIYPSAYEPWSEVLTGQQGLAPQPYYDPLQFMITESHRRGIEFHAWFNPYRAVSNIQRANLDSMHVANRHPEWLLSQGNLRLLDPGLPEVRSHVTRVIMDVLRRYDVDGIHFDDYFYPYPQAGAAFDDDSTFALYNRGFTSRPDWRRDNVDLLVKAVSDSIKRLKPWVKFGISPCGVWQNWSPTQPLGSETRGLQSYSTLYADSRKWIQQGWIDYIAPQLYWHIGHAPADYSVILPWWANNTFGRHLYIGQGVYRLNPNGDRNWRNPSQKPNQLRLNRQFATIQGSIWYNTKSLLRNPLGIRDSLETDFYAYPALRPSMPWKDNVPPPAPAKLLAAAHPQGIALHWQRPKTKAGELNRIRQYVVYRFDEDEPVNLEKSEAILSITPTDTTAFVDHTVEVGHAYRYVVTALDRLHNESPASNVVTSQPALATIAGNEPLIIQTRLKQSATNLIQIQSRIRYRVPQDGFVVLTVMNSYGWEVSTLVEEKQKAGEHTIIFQAENFPAGTYYAVLRTGDGRESRKMLLQL
ncbi:glycoside hydrolase family 10 protein [Nibrella saemangeumensis]|uniref:Glycoside hydrolase family 10 protein n=1 Tax=Nibrella saemangeumensis TaxID=1084526 RepID=A0ABP8MJN5_9BACT